jgi:pyruvate ferredoxin oxidoreductase gamma subunit
MKDLVEIRWHSRGGQGAKTGALVLAEAAMDEGKYIQGFAEYGPERMGAPMKAYDRISTSPITVHYGITNPNVVVILDTTLIGRVDVAEGLAEDGVIVVNTPESPASMRSLLGIEGRSIFTIDASKIARDNIGRDIPNTPVIGALLKATNMMDIDGVIKSIRKKLGSKLRPEIVEGNVKAIKQAYEEVKCE